MNDPATAASIELIPVDAIKVLNPRVRNRRMFKEIVTNIERLGLKKPVTVTRRNTNGEPKNDLVCGQGRLEAYRTLRQREIPALVVDASADDCLLMSLIENCARRHHQAIDLLHDIQGLKHRGYRDSEIARKTDLSVEYVRGVIRLLEKSEYRLLRAVESGQIPVSVAVEIAEADDAGTQLALQQAYEQNILRGRKLLIAKNVVEHRRRRGKGLGNKAARQTNAMSAGALLRAYREDTDRKRLIIRKAGATQDRLFFVTEALRKLLADDNFVTLLRAESLDSLPSNLADRLPAGRET
jgi:ParB family chromosome partitioning protein